MLNGFNIENTAVVLVDHQVGTIEWAGGLTPAQREEVKMWARLTARFAKAAGMPIVLTSSLETEAQGLLLPDFQTILPEEYADRIKRTGVINAWEDENFANAVRATGKKNLLMSGLTTEVCLVPPALSAKEEGFNVIALFDSSGPNTLIGELYSRSRLEHAGIPVMTILPVITGLLGNYKNPAAGAFFQATQEEPMFALLAQGGIR